MAKATAPLFSIEASGQLARTLVYDRRGFVRQYVIPANPKTNDQADVRYPFLGVAAVTGQVGPTAKSHIKQAAEKEGATTYRWNAYLVGKALAGDYWDTKGTGFDHMEPSGKDAWETAAQNAGVTVHSLGYGTEPDHLAGRALWVVAWAMRERLDIGPDQDPNQGNATAWANYITS